MKYMQRVDPDGVPTLVQGIRYFMSDMTIEVRFFNDRVKTFPVETFAPDVGLEQVQLTTPQYFQIEQEINKLAPVAFCYWMKDE